MGRLVIISLALIAIMTSNCGIGSNKKEINSGFQSTDTGTVAVAFQEYEHNFGKVVEGEKVECVFTFKNEGTANLVLSSAIASCGCTVPKYDASPVPPGGKGNIKVVFNTSGRNGMQTKIITVKSNAITPVILLKITAEVITNK